MCGSRSAPQHVGHSSRCRWLVGGGNEQARLRPRSVCHDLPGRMLNLGLSPVSFVDSHADPHLGVVRRPAEAAAIGGTLARDASGCLVVRAGTVLRWPKGYSAQTSSSGVVEVLNTEGELVARTGWSVDLGGGLAPGAPTGPCLDGYQVFDVQGPVATLAP